MRGLVSEVLKELCEKKKNKGRLHLTYQELTERKIKGLCFKFEEGSNPLHQYKGKQSRLETW